MNRAEAHLAGLVIAGLLHVLLLVFVIAQPEDGGCAGGSDADAAARRFENAQTIEAALAFQEVAPEKQPQKQKKEKYRPPDAPTVADPNAVAPPPEQPKHDIPVKKEEIDPESILKKHRLQDPELSSTGADKVPHEGSASGSEWGTEREAKGHPYAGELKGRIYNVWQVPSLEKGAGVAEGCVKLDRSGKIVDRAVKKKSGNANLDRSVELALRKAPDMQTPVPSELVELVTEKGICFRFTLEGN